MRKTLFVCLTVLMLVAIPLGAAWAAAPDPKTTPAPVPPQGKLYFPVFDNDATKMKYNLWVLDLATKERKILLDNTSQPVLSHDGKAIAYKWWAEGSEKSGLYAAVLNDIAGTKWRFAPYMNSQRPQYAPNDSFFVFNSRHESDRLDRIMMTKGAAAKSIFRPDMDNKEIMGISPTVVMPGKAYAITYQGCEITKCGVWQRGLDGANPVEITGDTTDQALASSPDGKWIAFMSWTRAGARDWEVYVMAADGSKIKRLTNSPGIDGLPTWSPDGKWIAFVRETKQGSNIWDIMAVQPDGAGETKLAELGVLSGKVKNTTKDQSTGWLEEQIAWGQ